jgi:MscS family membrane protein
VNILGYDVLDFFQSIFWNNLEAFKLIGAVILLYILKRPIVAIKFKVFSKMASKTKTDLDDRFFKAIRKPTELLVFVILVYVILSFFEISPEIKGILIKALNTLGMYSVVWGAYKLTDVVTDILSFSLNKTNMVANNMLVPFFRNVYRVLVLVLGTLMIINEWQDVGFILTGLGLGGLAFALAAQDTASNLFGSVMIILSKPFEIGDFIRTSNAEGIVEEIGFRSTSIRTLDRGLIVVPNSLMNNIPITNWSKREKRRARYTLGFTYDSTKEQIMKFKHKLIELLKEDDRIHDEGIVVNFTEFNSSSLDVLVQFFTKTTDYNEYLIVNENINIEIMKLVEELELSMAFPTQSIYIEKE